jgi:hypothetical protein
MAMNKLREVFCRIPELFSTSLLLFDPEPEPGI